ncbi:4'-phosphopantetheinyl transferase [Corynebacterium heidelbergense]|uniref:4'-phosphopantetheinyl transferase n=2 Tax=Corynebacterium heidelbergense TaxID=2055947 RepID=A0A364V3J3_9CORY|nr:4'-phosphopantetheinyl transferase superfamily protein [Corynebacterium heidelbergense]RAV31201.1 4'-phosphopantetheinyl transferase [Corynebacterium heidelbergense]
MSQRTVELPHAAALSPRGELEEPVVAADMLPTGTRTVELHVPPTAPTLEKYELLDAEERALVATAVDRRKADFGDSRWCAHQAMSSFGPDLPILRGRRGMPLFPDAITGSLTHTDGYRAALVGSSTRWASLGIDAEPATALPDGVLEAIARPAELRRLRRLRRGELGELMGKVLFSAKESTYKAWFPLTHRFLDFDEADIDIRADGTFTAHLLAQPQPVPFIEGRWIISGGFIATVTAVRRY